MSPAQARYVDDIPVPQALLHLAFGLSKWRRGRITALDLSAVRASAGGRPCPCRTDFDDDPRLLPLGP
jgi:xanthine dehydrogenase molybdopterin-binding subunit B